jgi:hypothetical protein
MTDVDLLLSRSEEGESEHDGERDSRHECDLNPDRLEIGRRLFVRIVLQGVPDRFSCV